MFAESNKKNVDIYFIDLYGLFHFFSWKSVFVVFLRNIDPPLIDNNERKFWPFTLGEAWEALLSRSLLQIFWGSWSRMQAGHLLVSGLPRWFHCAARIEKLPSWIRSSGITWNMLEMQTVGPTSESLNQKFWGWGSSILCFKSPQGYSNASWHLRTIALD